MIRTRLPRFISGAGNFWWVKAPISSRAAVSWSVFEPSIRSCQRFRVGSAMKAGLPLNSSRPVPMPSEWSDTTRKSSGRSSWASTPLEERTFSPRAKRRASSGVRREPNRMASVEFMVWRWVSPQ